MGGLVSFLERVSITLKTGDNTYASTHSTYMNVHTYTAVSLDYEKINKVPKRLTVSLKNKHQLHS